MAELQQNRSDHSHGEAYAPWQKQEACRDGDETDKKEGGKKRFHSSRNQDLSAVVRISSGLYRAKRDFGIAMIHHPVLKKRPGGGKVRLSR